MIRPYRDDDGRLRAGVDTMASALGDFLETEVGENPAVFETLADGLAQVRGHSAQGWEFHGSVYHLRLTPGVARLDNAEDPRAPRLDLSLSTLESVLGAWRRAWLSTAEPPPPVP